MPPPESNFSPQVEPKAGEFPKSSVGEPKPRRAPSANAKVASPPNHRAGAGSTDHAPGNLIQVPRMHAAQRPAYPAFVHLFDGHADEESLSYSQFDLKARAIAVRLRELGAAGEPVLLAFPPGLEFVTAFFGCLYAGSVAVPVYLPRRRTLDRFLAIAADSGARVALSTARSAAQHRTMQEMESEQGRSASDLLWVATDSISSDTADGWTAPIVGPQTLAMLQYTSGSTSQPKGVMLSHANLFQNARYINQSFGVAPGDVGVFWLPMYHDMGLVGGVLSPVLAGLTNLLMSPQAFLQHPYSWLSAVSRHGATISGGPNFAYDLCVRRITDAELGTLDLSSWSLAFTGAEPIAPATLERFAQRFAPCGFRADAFFPCYGLAEATLMVSGSNRRGGGPTIHSFDGSALALNRVELESAPAEPGESASAAHRLVASGSVVEALRVAIVDSQTHREVHGPVVGEIWVSGPSIGQGYWKNPGQTRKAFGAFLADTAEGPFLRTGDLGFLSQGQLYITGRVDDLIIIRGLNHYPQDIEASARVSHPALETGSGAAFVLGHHEDKRLILVQEIAVEADLNLGEVLNAIRTIVHEEHGLALDAIVLVRSGTIPKTSSGKVRRRACRATYLSGGLKVMAESRSNSFEPAQVPAAHHAESPVPPSIPGHPPAAIDAVYHHVRRLGAQNGYCSQSQGHRPPDLTPDTPLSSLSLDSLRRMELIAALEKTYGGRLPDASALHARTVGDLSRMVQEHLIDRVERPVDAGQIPSEHYQFLQFPEFVELKQQEAILTSIADANPYFRVDEGGGREAGTARIEGRDLVQFCAYDYLGMARDPQVVQAAKDAIDRYGTSAGASRLVSGEKQVHGDLERALARFLGVPAALAFVSGHATNVSVIGHLFGPADLILHDALAHNSILQGARLSGATVRSFAHNDWQALDAMLAEGRHRHRRALIAIEGVYSMDGDWPDLPRFVELKKKHKTLLLVDEAHSLGTMGPTGRGIGEHFGAARADVDLWMGTLSKTLASCGGYIGGESALIDYLKYTVPGFVYSVGLSPSGAAAALASLGVLEREPNRVVRLGELSRLFLELAKSRGLDTGLAAGSPVVPVILGNSVKSLRLSQALFEQGINVRPIMYPAVPEQAARLRFFITATHTLEQVRSTVDAVAQELARL